MAFGFLNVFKPVGPTSHDIVLAARRGTGERRIGHAGTLDPNAEGVLILALGKATRLVEYLATANKKYLARLRLGVITDSYDTEGVRQSETAIPSDYPRLAIEEALTRFQGSIMQVPPAYSAVKIRGKTAYSRARSGETFQLDAREVTITNLEIVGFAPPDVELLIECSAGTYVRSLAHDLGQALGVGATLSQLRRLASGSFLAEDAIPWEALQNAFEDSTWCQHLLQPDLALEGLPALTLTSAELDDVLHGRSIRLDAPAVGCCRAYTEAKVFVGILASKPGDDRWYPHKILIENQYSKNSALASKGTS